MEINTPEGTNGLVKLPRVGSVVVGRSRCRRQCEWGDYAEWRETYPGNPQLGIW